MSYIDLQQVIEDKEYEPETYEAWQEALSGYSVDLKWFAENSRTAIPEDEFEDYAREYAEDIGAIGQGAPWPADCIDWGRAANALKMDYFEVEVEGETYLIRS